MTNFECVWKEKDIAEKWPGKITDFNRYPEHYEIWIQSRSSIRVIFGKLANGFFACMPDFRAGCYLVDLHDKFWNMESLVRALGPVDGITVANALYSLADTIKF